MRAAYIGENNAGLSTDWTTDDISTSDFPDVKVVRGDHYIGISIDRFMIITPRDLEAGEYDLSPSSGIPDGLEVYFMTFPRSTGEIRQFNPVSGFFRLFVNADTYMSGRAKFVASDKVSGTFELECIFDVDLSKLPIKS